MGNDGHGAGNGLFRFEELVRVFCTLLMIQSFLGWLMDCFLQLIRKIKELAHSVQSYYAEHYRQ